MRKISKITLTAVLCSLSLLSAAPGLALTASAATAPQEESAAPQADIKQWVYERRGKELYKRLYNTTLGIWEGDWIFVRIVEKNPNGSYPGGN